MVGAVGITRRTVIGEPSDSKRKSYFLPVLSVAEQTTLVTWPEAKLPSCTHLPDDFRTAGTGRPSAFGWFFELSSIRSTGRSYRLSLVRWPLSPENEMMWLESAGSSSAMVKYALPCTLWA